MFKFLVFLTGLVAVSFAAETKHVPLVIPAVLQDLIPKEAKQDLDKLTAEQHLQLEQAFRKYGANAKAISADLKLEHPELAKKVQNTMEDFEKKIEKLTAEGKQYISKIIHLLQHLKNEKDLKETAKQLITDWNDLEKGTKESVEKSFPSIPKVLGSDKFQKIADMEVEKE